jgi:hypothetical protein
MPRRPQPTSSSQPKYSYSTEPSQRGPKLLNSTSLTSTNNAMDRLLNLPLARPSSPMVSRRSNPWRLEELSPDDYYALSSPLPGVRTSPAIRCSIELSLLHYVILFRPSVGHVVPLNRGAILSGMVSAENLIYAIVCCHHMGIVASFPSQFRFPFRKL